MANLGVLFAIDEQTVKKLKAFGTDEDRLDFLQEEIEATIMGGEPANFAELEKSWDALHRSLTGGQLEWNSGQFPLSHVILGGESIYGRDNYIMALKTPQQVCEISKAVQKLSKAELRAGYGKINKKEYAQFSEDDFEYTWDWFQDSLAFWRNAAEQKKFVLFTADQ
jgi:hypothetical protein